MNPRQPFQPFAVETVAIPIRPQDDGLGDAVKGTLSGNATTASTRAEDHQCRQMP
jgi:hypothetical protein